MSKASVKYTNKKGEFTLKNGVLTNSEGKRVTAKDISTRRDPLVRAKTKAK